MNPNQRILVHSDAAALSAAAAQLFVEQARWSVDDHGVFRVALSGGNTPKQTYSALAGAPYRDEVDWDRVQVFFSDERWVPPDSPESNFRMAQETLLSKVPIPGRFVHPVATVDVTPEESAVLYAQGIRRVFEAGLTEIPRFDLLYLGLGEDGHTASLFPETAALAEGAEIVAPNFVPKLDSWRITFTYPLLNASQCVAFLVQGESKASIVGQVLGGTDLPAARVRPTNGRLLWLLDRAAAASLPSGAQVEA